jgi:hypothetical protein
LDSKGKIGVKRENLVHLGRAVLTLSVLPTNTRIKQAYQMSPDSGFAESEKYGANSTEA